MKTYCSAGYAGYPEIMKVIHSLLNIIYKKINAAQLENVVAVGQDLDLLILTLAEKYITKIILNSQAYKDAKETVFAGN